MTGRDYDFILDVDNTINFVKGNTLIGNTSLSFASIVAVDSDNNQLKVKVANVHSEFAISEKVLSNSSTNFTQVTTASANISSITNSPFIASKNAFQIEPEVVLYSIYYPGEWYPPTSGGNPSREGLGYAWPYEFPLRYASVIGDVVNNTNYTLQRDSKAYTVVPINSSGVSLTAEGTGDLVLQISNYDGAIVSLLENTRLVGNANANAVTATVGGELVTNIDARTDPTHVDHVLATEQLRGTNTAIDYATATQVLNGPWTSLKTDSRDLLGAVVEVSRTYAKYLDVWPEFGTINSAPSANTVEVINPNIYRVGDSIKSNTIISSEVIKNGNFDSTSYWSAGSGWSISAGNADKTTGTGTLEQVVDILGNKRYDLSFMIDNITTDALFVEYSLDNGGSYENIVTIEAPSGGTFDETFTTINDPGTQGLLRFRGNNTSVVSNLDTVSLVENTASLVSTIVNIDGSNITVSEDLFHGNTPNTFVYIVNSEADPHAGITDVYKINTLNSFNEFFAEFNLTSWVQYSSHNIPTREYNKNVCPFKYKGAECQYPDQGSGFIPNTNSTISANGMFTITNVSTTDTSLDICNHTYKSCKLRNNNRHFGGFTRVGNNE